MSAQTDQVAYIGIGSNQGDPLAEVAAAIIALDKLPGTHVAARSSFYRTRPVGPQDQPDFVNAVAKITTSLSARQLLAYLQDIENRAGRVRSVVQWGPRILDLDILLFGDEQIDQSDFQVPHHEMTKRAFVLIPLSELSADLSIPGAGPVADLLRAVDSSGVTLLEDKINE